MKRKWFYRSLFVLSLAAMILACSYDDDDQNDDNSQEISQIENNVQSGTWRVSSYIDSGDNETSDFNGYNFTFGTDGALVATNGTITYNGTWSVTDSSNSSDDSNSDNDIDFNIFFPVPDDNDFEDLNDDWDIVSHNSTTLSLMDVSGGDGSTDTLVFQKN
ncbi:hypothetical protein [Winogradskyella flava]|uniref:hypothetical protein n=1 Tax=Winogradskyella flava TaxID=1884876 RepID=UPI002490CE32|nr:hypothetical protein [Winogradskyella flava]